MPSKCTYFADSKYFVFLIAAPNVQQLQIQNNDSLSVTSVNYPHSCCQDAIIEVIQADKVIKILKIMFTNIDVPPRSMFMVGACACS